MLLEVMVALVILSMVVATLGASAQRALSASVRGREGAASLSQEGFANAGRQAWEWGPAVERATWGAGPLLRLSGGSGMGAGGTVGIWADGWQVGEWKVSAGAELVLGADLWHGLAGKELVIRARVDTEAWGPPWRSVVPDTYGSFGAQAVGGAAEPAEGLGYDDGGCVAHMRSHSTPLLLATWTDAPVFENLQGVVSVLAAAGPGVVRLDSYARSQAWVACPRRRLDVYF